MSQSDEQTKVIRDLVERLESESAEIASVTVKLLVESVRPTQFLAGSEPDWSSLNVRLGFAPIEKRAEEHAEEHTIVRSDEKIRERIADRVK